jgi:hypothetical protein
MVHAARISTASAPAPLSTRHFLIASRQIIKNRANPFTINEKTLSNR